jgi:hypothetical protein
LGVSDELQQQDLLFHSSVVPNYLLPMKLIIIEQIKYYLVKIEILTGISNFSDFLKQPINFDHHGNTRDESTGFPPKMHAIFIIIHVL